MILKSIPFSKGDLEGLSKDNKNIWGGTDMQFLTFFCMSVLCISATALSEPLRLYNDEPMVGIYYFTHWWEPWKSDDEAILKDFGSLRSMGFNTILLDQEWSQAIDGNWKWLDRDFRLAKQSGLSIVPWLSLKTWSDISPGHRAQLAKEWFGVDMKYGITQDGKSAAPLIYDESVLIAGSKYAIMYLDRYISEPILRLRWGGKDRPVICLGVESAWDGSFDETTNLLFCQWLKNKYGDVDSLNKAWGTSIASFFDVNPRNTDIFDYAGHIEGKAKYPIAIEDHVAFRAGIISDSLARMASMVRQKYPDVLFLAEIPYQYGSQHPHAQSYRISYAANPRSCEYADIVLFRNTAPLTADEAKTLQDYQKTGQKFILTYRTYSDWDVEPESQAFIESVKTYAEQASSLANGFGFYSFNEMGDTHIAYSTTMSEDEQKGWTKERSEKSAKLMGEMVKHYIESVIK
jgi:hypothetical protein